MAAPSTLLATALTEVIRFKGKGKMKHYMIGNDPHLTYAMYKGKGKGKRKNLWLEAQAWQKGKPKGKGVTCREHL